MLEVEARKLESSAVSVSWRLPHHRIGTVLSGLERPHNGPSRELRLDVSQAELVCKRVLGDSYGAYSADVGRVLQKHSDANDPVSKVSDIRSAKNEGPTLSFGPGQIIDFPRIWLKSTALGWVEARLCMTVCLFESRSKFWVRFVAHRAELDRDAAEDFLPRFRDVTREWTVSILNHLVDAYQSDLQSVTGSDVELKVRNIVQFFGIDTAAADIDTLADHVRFGEKLYIGHPSTAAGTELLLLAKIMEASAKSAGGGGDEFIVPIAHTTSRGRTGVFVRLNDEKSLSYIGIGALAPDEVLLFEAQRQFSNSVNPEIGRELRTSGMLQVTAEMANMIARNF